jgi:hypothetical protein
LGREADERHSEQACEADEQLCVFHDFAESAGFRDQ